MTHAFLDTNILLDHLLHRDPFHIESASLFGLCESKELAGFISAGSMYSVSYVVRKVATAAKTKQVLADLLSLFEIIPQPHSVFKLALSLQLKDAEDAFQAAAALSHASVQCIITRNVNDFHSPALRFPVLKPAVFLSKYYS